MIGFRKFAVVVLVIAAVVWAPMNEHGADVLKMVLATFVAGNMVEHVAKGGLGEKVMAMARRRRGIDPGIYEDAKKGDNQ